MMDLTTTFPIPRTYPRASLDLKRIDGIAVHHTATFFLRPDAIMQEEVDQIRMIHEYHKRKGYGGFGYHIIVFPSGRRYLVVPLDQYGAAVYENNDHLLHVALAGNFTLVTPGPAQFRSTAEGILDMYTFLGREVSIRPHQAWAPIEWPTACPGATWPQWLPGFTPLIEQMKAEIETEEEEDVFQYASHYGLGRAYLLFGPFKIWLSPDLLTGVLKRGAHEIRFDDDNEKHDRILDAHLDWPVGSVKFDYSDLDTIATRVVTILGSRLQAGTTPR